MEWLHRTHDLYVSTFRFQLIRSVLENPRERNLLCFEYSDTPIISQLWSSRVINNIHITEVDLLMNLKLSTWVTWYSYQCIQLYTFLQTKCTLEFAQTVLTEGCLIPNAHNTLRKKVEPKRLHALRPSLCITQLHHWHYFPKHDY